MSRLVLVEQASSPSTPATGRVELYYKTDGFWYYKDDNGTEQRLVVTASSGAINLVSAVAGTNTITGTTSPSIGAYANGQFLVFIPANDNTGATTINIDGLGAKNIYSAGSACVGAEIKQNVPCLIEYDGTQFNIIGPAFAQAATQAQQEVGSSTTVFVTPGRQQYHPSAVKGWCEATVAGGITGSYNVSSVTDNGTGDAYINWATDFSADTYAAVACARSDSTSNNLTTVANSTTSAALTRILVRTSGGVPNDPDQYMIIACGDQS